MKTKLIVAIALFASLFMQAQSRFDAYYATAQQAFSVNHSPNYEKLIDSTVKLAHNKNQGVHQPTMARSAFVYAIAWLENDYDAAIAYAVKYDDNFSVERALIMAALSVSILDQPDKVLPTFEALPEVLQPVFIEKATTYLFLSGYESISPELEQRIFENARCAGFYSIALTKVDPYEALAAALRNEDRAVASNMIKMSLVYIALKDAAGAYELYLQHKELLSRNPDEGFTPLPTIVAELSKSNPRLAYTAAIEGGLSADEHSGCFHEIFSNWAELAPQEAMLESDQAKMPNGIRKLIFKKWLKVDPDESIKYATTLEHQPAFHLIRQLSYDDDYFIKQGAVLATMAQKVAKQHSAYIGIDADRNPLTQVLKKWALLDYEAAVQWIDETAEPAQKDIGYAALIRAYANKDIVYAQELFPHIQSESVRKTVAEDIGNVLADRNPIAGIQWLQTISAEIDTNAAVNDFFYNWSRMDIEDAIANFPVDAPLDFQRNALQGISRNAFYADPDALVDWLLTLHPSVSARGDWHLRKAFSMTNPEALIRLYQNNPNLGKSWHDWNRIALEHAQVDIDNMQRLALQLTGSARDAMMDGAAKTYLKHDREGMVAWMKSLESKADRELAWAAYVDQRHIREPKQCLEYALQIEDHKSRRKNSVSRAIEGLANENFDNALSIVRSDPRFNSQERAFALAYLQEGKKLPHQK